MLGIHICRIGTERAYPHNRQKPGKPYWLCAEQFLIRKLVKTPSAAACIHLLTFTAYYHYSIFHQRTRSRSLHTQSRMNHIFYPPSSSNATNLSQVCSSIAICTILYLIIGLIGAASSVVGPSNVLATFSNLKRPKGFLLTIDILFPLAVLVTSVPVYAIVTQNNLERGGCPRCMFSRSAR